MDGFFTLLKEIFDTFGNYITVPVIIYVICRIFRTPAKRAFQSAVLVGVGLMGMSFVTNAFGGVLTPLIQRMVDASGISKPALDIGWQAVAAVSYSTDLGMMFIGVGLIFQVVVWLLKITDIFMPSDLWNNYSISVWGSFLFLLCGNMLLAFALMLFVNLVTLLIAESVQKRWSTYFNYPGCCMTAPHHMGDAPLYLVLNIILSKLGFDRIKADPASIKKRIGVMGEPMYIGLAIGLLLGIVGNIDRIATLAGWGNVAQVAVMCAAVMAIFPRIAGMFAAGFGALTEFSHKTLAKSRYGQGRQFIVAVNDALGYGEAATLTTGLLIIPFGILIAFLLPGNLVIPLMVLPSLPYMVEIPVALSNGNVVKSLVMGIIVFIAKLLMASYWASAFTQVAAQAGFDPAVQAVAAGTFVIGFIMSNCTAGLITMAFLTQNPLIIALVVAVYIILYIVFRKNRTRFQDYLERLATGARPAHEAADGIAPSEKHAIV
ncbi:PTS system IIC component, Gat family [Coriobacterium glomerans PW2]|uniref:PTS system IIC component, Gat family n=1 Tax=Coriobacterium glomerans (strain ATCC 49209 / DSM 20642 / JCM 10262 / PW2) TaxID=700015 RepID=F2N8J3_CORGP|nr:PTS transporter subunit IIC [Coriobacterium glomerans]AEB07376.1 PTS system IIC component, Gat family [Coriobacterium glomerans PW2]